MQRQWTFATRSAETAVKAATVEFELPDTLVEIPVVYGGESGPDLDEVCEILQMSADEFIAMHTGAEHRVDLVGFTPGFVYVGGIGEKLNVPRRAEPRQRVPAGSIGVADGRTGLYALQSPGGWHLVGRTPKPLFDAGNDDPFPLQAGMRIRFVRVESES